MGCTWIVASLLISVALFLTFYKLGLVLHTAVPKPPAAAQAIPMLGHAFLFLNDPEKLASIVTKPSNGSLVRLILPGFDLWLVRSPANVWRVLSNPRTFDFVAVNSLILNNVLELPRKVIASVRKDNSGIASKPFAGTSVPPTQRFHHLKHKATHDVIGRSGLPTLVQHFEENLRGWIAHTNIGYEWVDMPDLFIFVRDLLFQTSVDAFFGPRLLQQSPNLTEDLWRFDKDLLVLSKGLPVLFTPGLRNARDKCIQAIKQWRESAKAREARSREARSEDISDWDENWGLKCMRLRNEVFKMFEEWDDDACAATDTVLLWAINTNVIPATFWLFFETIKSSELFEGARKEVQAAACDSGTGHFDHKKLLSSPLLQSIHAETLRMYVAIMMARETTTECQVGAWTIPKNQSVVVCSYIEHMNERLWNTGGPGDRHPIDKFWGKRFLDDKNCPPTFSMDSTRGKWLPFGLGERMCPGRHFAKHQMLLTFAYLTSNFEFEIKMPQGYVVPVDMQHFGFGTLPPACAVPFRMRKKLGT